RHEAGHAAGFVGYGYTRKPVIVGTEISHVEIEKNEAEAAVIVRIFELAAEGKGIVKIAELLRAENAPAPKSGWTKSTVFTALHREAYTGRWTFGKLHKQRLDKDPVTGKPRSKRTLNPESEWVVNERPALRIVSDALWNAAHAKLASARRGWLLAKPNPGTPQRRGNVPAGSYL